MLIDHYYVKKLLLLKTEYSSKSSLPQLEIRTNGHRQPITKEK